MKDGHAAIGETPSAASGRLRLHDATASLQVHAGVCGAQRSQRRPSPVGVERVRACRLGTEERGFRHFPGEGDEETKGLRHASPVL